MAYIFFYASILIMWILLLICVRFRTPDTAHTIIAIVTAAVSIVYDMTFGEYMGLYYYIHPQVSVIHTMIAALLIYPPANVIYTLFLPRNAHAAAMYTILWIGGMLVFEYASVLAGTVVFTGWDPFPWSPLTYVGTYLWVYFLFKYVKNRHYKLQT